MTDLATTAPDNRHDAIHLVRQKREFWRQVTYYSFVNLTLWLSWIFAGVRDGWGAPWALVPTAIGGAYLIARVYKLGGVQAVSHRTIDTEVDELQHRDEPPFKQRSINQIKFSDGGSYTNLPAFHLQDIIDAREHAHEIPTHEIKAHDVGAHRIDKNMVEPQEPQPIA